MEENSVKFIRLSTGEDLVSEVLEIDEGDGVFYYQLANPMKVVYMIPSNKPGVFSISLMQWIFNRLCSDQSFTLHPTSIITMGDPTESLIEYYWKSVDSFDENKEKLEKNTEFIDEDLENEILEKYKDYLMSEKLDKRKLN